MRHIKTFDFDIVIVLTEFPKDGRTMKQQVSHRVVPLTRVMTLLPYTSLLQTMGAPVERLLKSAGIPADLLSHPAAALPLENAFRFIELACRTQGSEHLGLHVGLATSLDDLGPYGYMLQNALTIHDYLRKGISLYNMLTTGQHFWISEHGDELRVNVASTAESIIGIYQSEIESLAIIITKFREAAGKEWSPREISLAYRSREALPAIDLYAGSRILQGTGETYFTIPRAMMGLRFPSGSSGIQTREQELLEGHLLPENLDGLVQLQIESMLSRRPLQIDVVAETLAMSTRSLQRSLAKQGLSYSQVLVETRMRQAVTWLETTDKPIAKIASDLGYWDASNFTRAFRRQAGVAPQVFRDNAMKR